MNTHPNAALAATESRSHAAALATVLALAVAAVASAQDARPVAFTNARLVPIEGDVIPRGTLVIKNGKIEAIGKDAAVPAGARIVDATGKTIMPGLVSAFSRAGLTAPPRPVEAEAGGGRRGRGQMPPMPSGGGSAQNRAATKVVEGLYAKQEIFGELLQRGVTSLALTPNGSAFPGLGAVLRPDGKTLEQLTVDDDAFLLIGMRRETATKKMLKETFEKAQKIVEERKKPEKPAAAAAPAAKPEAGKPENGKTEPPKSEPPKPEPPKPEPPKPEPPKPEPPKPEPPKPEPKPTPGPDDNKEGGAAATAAPARREAPKDPNLEIVADLLEGKLRAIVQIDSAADMLHWQTAVADTIVFPRAIVVTRHDTTAGTIDNVLEQLQAMKCPVLLPPDLSTQPRSRVLTHPAKTLHDAGIEIGFVLGDSPAALRLLSWRLIELVRAGLPADVALRAVTLVPAKALGIDKSTGSLEVGKNADFLVFDGDPLSATGSLGSVWIGGREVPPQP